MRTINHAELVSIQAVARHGSITAAAEALGLAKSAVSKHVSQLEARLGVVLVLRQSRSVRLTAEGERLLPRIQSLLAEGERLFDEALDQTGRTDGTVHIAATPEFGGFVADTFFPLVRAAYPDLRLTMRVSYDWEDMQSGAFDLAFRIQEVQDDRLVARELGAYRRVLVASPDYPGLADLKQPADLANETCLVFSAPDTRAGWLLTSPGVEGVSETVQVSGPVAVRSFIILQRLAEQGQGIAWLPDLLVREAREAGRLVRVLPEWESHWRPLYLTYRPGSEQISRLKCVIDLARQHLPGLIRDVTGD